MPIRPLLESDEGVFGPDDVKVISAVFDDLLRSLQLVDRSDPAVTMVAKLTIEAAKQGERDPIRLREKVMKLMST
jgi:hypothetical protein